MRDVTGVGSNVPGSPSRSDIGLHDLTGGNTFVPDIIPDFFPDVDVAALQAGKLRAESMLSLWQLPWSCLLLELTAILQ